jgi:glycine/D-amino acid oxidase-like deaminating enzyme
MDNDVIIVGQGLAGSMLALTLMNDGMKVLVINQPEHHNSSRVAAGIVNPITGKRVVKTWLADQLFPTLHSFYTLLEQQLEARFFYSKSIYKPYDSVNEQNYCISKSGPEDYANYMNIQPDDTTYSKFLNNPLGGFEIKEGGYLDTNTFLDACVKYFSERNILIHARVDIKDLIIQDDKVTLQNYSAKYIVFCEGHHVTGNPYFNWLPFAPAKGEVLTIESDKIATENAVSKGIFVLPNGHHKFRVGATYAWTFEDLNTTQKAYDELTSKLNEIITVPYKVIDHKTGIRPATKLRRPLIGQHPAFNNVGIFNGFGSKGVSLIPYFAKQYVQFLKNQTELLPEVNIEQYLSLYLKSKNIASAQ